MQQQNHFISTLNNICPLEKCKNGINSNHDVVRFKCGHSFHMDCIMDVLRDKSGPYCDACDYIEQYQKPEAQKRTIERSNQLVREQQQKHIQIHSLHQAIYRHKITTLEGLVSTGLKPVHILDRHSYPLDTLFKAVNCTPLELHNKLSIPNLEFVTQLYTAAELSQMGYDGKTLISLGLTDENLVKHFPNGSKDLEEFYFTPEELNSVGYQLIVDPVELNKQEQQQRMEQKFIGNAKDAVLQAKEEMLRNKRSSK